jgi:hypothetical protein
MRHLVEYQISAINSCWEKCDEKWAYMFNVTKNQQSRQTRSRNLMGPKTLPTIWHTPYRGKRFWTHQIPTSCLPTLLIFRHIELICSFFVAFFSVLVCNIYSYWQRTTSRSYNILPNISVTSPLAQKPVNICNDILLLLEIMFVIFLKFSHILFSTGCFIQ